MIIARTRDEVRHAAADLRKRGRLGFVPTMGALHAGHASLLRLARQQADHVAASIFVNPTQFGPHEDLARYPRPIEKDLALCEEAGVDLLFLPGVQEIYPSGSGGAFVEVPSLSSIHEGASRPGHFRGVATVVTILFNLLQPDAAFFGQKDGQQVAVIRRMIRDLALPVELVVGPTVREPDGLALSSRNVYLDPDSRQQAPVLYRALALGARRVAQGELNAGVLHQELTELIRQAPLAQLDYLVFVDPDSLESKPRLTGRTMAAVAARFGSTRLIDNMIYEGQSA